MIAAAAATALLCLAVPADAGCSKSIVMYNASWCPYCRQVRAILARNHIKYSIFDATTPQVQAVMLKRFGDTAVPRTIIGGVLVEGVDERRGSGSSAASTASEQAGALCLSLGTHDNCVRFCLHHYVVGQDQDHPPHRHPPKSGGANHYWSGSSSL